MQATLGGRTYRGIAAMVVSLIATCAIPAASQTADALFDSSVLHDINITMREGDWAALQEHYLEDTYYRADMQWRDLTIPIVGVRSRGSASRNPHKPGLKISFDQYISQKPFGLKSIVLANGIQDPAMLKQRLGLKMFAKIGMPAPRVAHARVFVNRRYIGLYQLIEPIDKLFLARVYGKHADGVVENNGYLYEYAWKDAYLFDYLGDDLRIYAELFEPKSHETDAPAVLYGPLEDLFRTFNSVSDSQFEREVGRLLDLHQFARHLAVENFIAEYDGFLGHWGPNNFYLYRFQNREISQVLPWDKDMAFWDIRYDIFQNIESNVLALRALQVPSVYHTYVETLIECARAASEPDEEGSSTGWLEAEVYRTIQQIHDAGLEDENKRFSSERFDDELIKVLEFAGQRGPYVLREASKALAHASLGR
jgi:spore coat protein CotH